GGHATDRSQIASPPRTAAGIEIRHAIEEAHFAPRNARRAHVRARRFETSTEAADHISARQRFEVRSVERGALTPNRGGVHACIGYDLLRLRAPEHPLGSVELGLGE